MWFASTDDQRLFVEVAQRFLDSHCQPSQLRTICQSGTSLDRQFWADAATLGWTSLLVGEEAGGGSVSENGIRDAMFLAFECGRYAAPGPLIECNVVAHALDIHSSHPHLLDGLVRGDQVSTWAVSESLLGSHSEQDRVRAERTAQGYRLNGQKQPVEAAADSDFFLVTSSTEAGSAQFVVPRTASGVSIEILESVDLTRTFGTLSLSNVEVNDSAVLGVPGRCGPSIERQLQIALLLQTAEMLGAMQRGFDMTLSWAFDRHSFGRPLASYQELKHRFADMALWLAAGYGVVEATAEAIYNESKDAGSVCSASKAYVGHYGTELLHDCVQIHGGIGVTEDLDLHLYLRRFVVNLPIYGGVHHHHDRQVRLLEEQQ